VQGRSVRLGKLYTCPRKSTCTQTCWPSTYAEQGSTCKVPNVY
jgi:hypothetical protein